MLVNLNDATTATEAPSTDWLHAIDLGGGEYNFGFWNIFIKTFQNGGARMEIKGVSKKNLFDILAENGYCKRYRNNGTFILVQNTDNILDAITPAQMKDFCIKMIDNLPEQVQVLDFNVSKEKLKEVFFKEHHNLFGENALSPLPTNTAKFLSDEKKKMYFPFLNGVVVVTAKDIQLIDYSELKDLCIWREHIIQREYTPTNNKSMYEDFIRNVARTDERYTAMRCAIGYALHRHYDTTNTRAIILYDEAITDAQSAHGGTGKGVFVSGLGYCRTVETIDGKKYDTRNRFALDRVTEQTQIIFFDDVRTDFDFEHFNSVLTDGWEYEAKNQKTVRVSLEDSPKMLISSNSILKCKDGNTTERRQYVLEFASFYSDMKEKTNAPLIDVHGCEFFYEWQPEQWNEFYSFMFLSCQLYLQKGLPMVKTSNVAINRLIQETDMVFMEWMERQNFVTHTDYHYSQNFNDFKAEFTGENSFFSSATFTKWLKLYAKTQKMNYSTSRFNTVTYFRFT